MCCPPTAGFGMLRRGIGGSPACKARPSEWMLQRRDLPARPRDSEGARTIAAQNHASRAQAGNGMCPRRGGNDTNHPEREVESMPQPTVLVVDDVPENL